MKGLEKKITYKSLQSASHYALQLGLNPDRESNLWPLGVQEDAPTVQGVQLITTWSQSELPLTTVKSSHVHSYLCAIQATVTSEMSSTLY